MSTAASPRSGAHAAETVARGQSANHARFSILQKVSCIAAVAAVCLLVVLGISLAEFFSIRTQNDRLLLITGALQRQQFADMMHDALRGDALFALLAARDRDQATLAQISKDYQEHADSLRSQFAQNEKLPLGPEVARHLAEVNQPLQRYVTSVGEIITLARQDEAKARAAWPEVQRAFGELEDSMAKLSEAIEESAKRANAETAAGFERFIPEVVATATLSLLALATVSWLVARSIPKPFAALIAQLRESARLNGHSADLLAGNSKTVAEGASAQAAAVEETSASLQELSATADQNAVRAKEVRELSHRARQAVDRSATDVTALTSAMAELNTASDSIAKIVKTIDEIAFQTNILALNAAVEAARAGEAGAGFAVVAEEVRGLAQRSAQAAHETSGRISDSIEKSRRSAQLSERVATGLQEVSTIAHAFDQQISEIAQATDEQTASLQQVTQAVSQIDTVIQANAASAEEAASVSQEMLSQSATVQSVVGALSQLVGKDGESAANSPAPRSMRPITLPRHRDGQKQDVFADAA
jgi:methyl-accepting chemotaxis protein